MPEKTINFNNYTPYYRQLYLILRERILAKEWKPSQKFLSEGELCRDYSISRTVVRNALLDLENEGLISRKKGKGTFVLGPKISEGLAQNLTGFYQDMADRGLTTRTLVLLHEVIPSPDTINSYLNLKPQTPVIHINRLRYVEDEPIALVTSYIPQNICPALEFQDLTNCSLYEYLESTCGIILTNAQRVLEAKAANETQAQLLEIDSGDPVIKLESISFLEDGTPVEYFVAFHRGDRTRFEINLLRVRDKWRMLSGDKPDDF